MDSSSNDAQNEAAIGSEEYNLERNVNRVFNYLEGSKDLDSDSPSDFEDVLTENISASEDYEVDSIYEIGGSVVYEIVNTGKDLNDIISLSYDNEGHMEAETRVE